MKRYAFQNAPRCTSMSKRTRKPCQAPAVRGWSVCRFHGARGGAPKGERNGMYRHGLYTAEAIDERKQVQDLTRRAKASIAACRWQPDLKETNELGSA